ncbi:hypothetical protein MRB53_038378 [Persea americana]|nr:hypothetical protein MRB53_038378 [Persea americana]
MVLSAHIDPDELISQLNHHPHQHRARISSAISHSTPYSTRYNAQTELSKFKIPHDGAPADAVHQMLKDELDLDGRKKEKRQSELRLLVLPKPFTLAVLPVSYNSSPKSHIVAEQSSLLCLVKRRWQEKRMAEGKDTSKPNILMSANAQVALEKFARYFEVEARILPVSAKSNYRLDPELVKENIDENTIGVFVILGSTYTGASQLPGASIA